MIFYETFTARAWKRLIEWTSRQPQTNFQYSPSFNCTVVPKVNSQTVPSNVNLTYDAWKSSVRTSRRLLVLTRDSLGKAKKTGPKARGNAREVLQQALPVRPILWHLSTSPPLLDLALSGCLLYSPRRDMFWFCWFSAPGRIPCPPPPELSKPKLGCSTSIVNVIQVTHYFSRTSRTMRQRSIL
jgi:hypothetical protein